MTVFVRFLSLALLLLWLHCGGGGSIPGLPSYAVGGDITGLSETVVLQNNGTDDLTLTENGSFTFSTEVENNTTYEVTVQTQPSSQTCSVSSGTGIISDADVTNVSIVCSEDTYTVGGTITGLSSETVVLQNNSGDNLTLMQDGSFTFSTAVADGAGYSVTVLTQPDFRTCSISDSSGTIDGDNIIDVAVVCSLDTYTVGGTLSGLSGTVVLQNNNGDNLTLSGNSSFTFSTAVADGAGYAVTVLTQPSRQTCTVTSGSGTIDGTNETNVTVTCVNDIPSFLASTGSENGGASCTSNVAFFTSGQVEGITVTSQTASSIAATTPAYGGGTNLWTGTKSGNTYTLTSENIAATTGLTCAYKNVVTVTGTISPFSCTQIAEVLTNSVGGNNCENELDYGNESPDEDPMDVAGTSCTDTYDQPTCTAQ